MPMNAFRPARLYRLISLLTALPAVASAHPGHDGGHDLTWDFGSLGHVHYGPMLVASVLLVGAAIVIAKLAAQHFSR